MSVSRLLQGRKWENQIQNGNRLPTINDFLCIVKE